MISNPPGLRLLTYNVCLHHLVTSLVTKFEEFNFFSKCIQARWKQILHPAMRLEIAATCKYACEGGRIYLAKKIFLARIETSFTLTDLAPGSLCEFTLKAVYNPASIDKGISVTSKVLPASMTASHTHV